MGHANAVAGSDQFGTLRILWAPQDLSAKQMSPKTTCGTEKIPKKAGASLDSIGCLSSFDLSSGLPVAACKDVVVGDEALADAFLGVAYPPVRAFFVFFGPFHRVVSERLVFVDQRKFGGESMLTRADSAQANASSASTG